MPEEQEEGFSFVDKRRVTAETEAGPAPDSADATESAPGESEDQAPEGFEPGTMGLPHLTVRDRVLMSIDILHQGAWITMGLRADPATGEIEQDLNAARTAIDCVAFLASKIENDLDEQTQRELKRIVSDLQMNYVNQSQRAQKMSGH